MTDSPPPASSGARRTVVNMLRSLVPLTLLIVVLVVVFQPKRQPIPTVDPANDFRYAASQLGTSVPSPHGLGTGWRSTSSDVATSAPGRRAVSVDVGYVTPGGNFARLVESGRPVAEVVRTQLRNPSPAGAVTIGGRRWARYRTDRGETALAGTLSGIGVVVTGNASSAEMRTLISSLR